MRIQNLYLDISEIDMGLYYAQRLKGMGISPIPRIK
jgi:hypothetical protein